MPRRRASPRARSAGVEGRAWHLSGDPLDTWRHYPLQPVDLALDQLDLEFRVNNYVAWWLLVESMNVLRHGQRHRPERGYRASEYRHRLYVASVLKFTTMDFLAITRGERWLTVEETVRLQAGTVISDALMKQINPGNMLRRELPLNELLATKDRQSIRLVFEEVSAMNVDQQQQQLQSLSESLRGLVRLAADMEDVLLAQDVPLPRDDWIGIDRQLAFGTGPASVKSLSSRAKRLDEQPTFRDQIRFLVSDKPVTPREVKARLSAEGIPFKVPRVHSALFALVQSGEIERLGNGRYRRSALNRK